MSVMRRHGNRCLHASIPHQRRHLRRVKNHNHLKAEMVECDGVAFTFWQEAKEAYRVVKREKMQKREEKKGRKGKLEEEEEEEEEEGWGDST